MHQKIRPSSSTWSENWYFDYSPVFKFSKNVKNWIKYFYIDSKWNIIWWAPKKFEIWKWSKIMIYNDLEYDINWKKVIKTDSIRPMIYWNYLSNTEMYVSILWTWNNQNIKTDQNWNFLFQPRFNLEKWKKYFIDFWTSEKNTILQISDEKLIPKIISHKNWDIEVSKRPEFFWNWFSWETVNIKIFNEDQSWSWWTLDWNNFYDIKCKNILDSDWKKDWLNNDEKFSQTEIFSCSDLWKKWEEKNIISWTTTVDKNWNWFWKPDEDLQEFYSDSENIFFVKVFYDWEEDKNYDLKSFRYFPKKEIENDYSSEILTWNSTWNFISVDWNNLKIQLNQTWEVLNIFDKSEISSNFWFVLKIPSYWWIKFLEDQDNWNDIKIEKWMWIYREKVWRIFLNQEIKIFHWNNDDEKFLQWDKIFLWAKESEINFSSWPKIFSYWKIKIFPNEKNIWKKTLITIPKWKNFYLKNSDKINLWYFDKIFNYLNEFKVKKNFSDITKNFQNYKKNFLTIFNQDEISSNKNFKVWEILNWKIIKEWEKFLIHWTSWPDTKLKFLKNWEIIWSTTTDWSWTFLFEVWKWFKKNIQSSSSSIFKLRIDLPEEKNISKEFLIKLSYSTTWTYLKFDKIENKNRFFKKEKWFFNHSLKINKLPVFNY